MISGYRVQDISALPHFHIAEGTSTLFLPFLPSSS